eukprot:gnl/TRDRNA2_/TRDRNA2_166290_c1_seq3.p1 gnl/TRDRNA2_/TRDRNA2_166290_c1~~gnl/TRDRNA2_/TRDRNA2_166290_c1_seq3.p1  ORF type:complete len:321 (-),score=31.02 gnl/TRDRNA2_/TRDRNA2_166290_c1_seq3:124-1086(-)
MLMQRQVSPFSTSSLGSATSVASEDLELRFEGQQDREDPHFGRSLAASVAASSFCVIDDGVVVRYRVYMELKLAPYQVTETMLPCGWKRGNRRKIAEAFEKWNAFISETHNRDKAQVIDYHPLDEKASRLVVVSSVLMFVLGFYVDKSVGWAVALQFYAVGAIIISALIARIVYRVVYAHLALNALFVEAKALAYRLQVILEAEGVTVRPVLYVNSKARSSFDQVGHSHNASSHFFLEFLVPVWTREKGEAHETAGDHKQQNDNTCSICLEQFEESQLVRVLPCSHRYHADCADHWLKTSVLCPMCKRPTGVDVRCTFTV